MSFGSVFKLSSARTFELASYYGLYTSSNPVCKERTRLHNALSIFFPPYDTNLVTINTRAGETGHMKLHQAASTLFLALSVNLESCVSQTSMLQRTEVAL